MRVGSPEMGLIWLIEFGVLVAGLVLLSILARAGKLDKLRQPIDDDAGPFAQVNTRCLVMSDDKDRYLAATVAHPQA